MDLVPLLIISDFGCQLQGNENNMTTNEEGEMEGDGNKAKQHLSITSLQMFQVESGRSLLLLQQDFLVRVFSMTMECEQFSSISGTLMDLKAMHPWSHSSEQTGRKDSQWSLNSKQREQRHAQIICLSNNGVIEVFRLLRCFCVHVV